jgi:hypothetical protein
MCDGIEYVRDDERIVVYFDLERAQLPVRKRSGAVQFVAWGARGDRYLTSDNTPGYLLKFPVGGCASRDSIREGAWQKFEPRPVRIVASRFILTDSRVGSVFFALKPGEYIQGLLAHTAGQQRVYVVTVEPPDEHAGKWRSWPRVITSRAEQASEVNGGR